MLSEHRNLAAAKRFFRSAKTVTGVIPERVTTDGHGAYPQAIRSELGSRVRHRTNCYMNNRLERDHRRTPTLSALPIPHVPTWPGDYAAL